MARVLFLTDVHNATSYLPYLIEQVTDIDLVLVGGDLTNFGGATAAAHVLAPLEHAFSHVLGVHGNVDKPQVATWLRQRGLSVHGRVHQMGGLAIYGCGGANPTPFGTPSELEEEQIRAVLDQGHEQVSSADATQIVVAHMPPYQTCADRILTKRHVGSTALRSFLSGVQPAVCLTGHIHESGCIDRLGGTLVVNPGPFSSGYFAVVDISEGKVKVERRRVSASSVRRVVAYSAMVAGKVGGFVSSRF